MNGEGNAQIEGFLADGWLEVFRNAPEMPELTQHLKPVCTIQCANWTFDGSFQRTKRKLQIHNMPTDGDFMIADLVVYPLRFAGEAMTNALRERGEMYWRCRERRYVCYHDGPDDAIEIAVSFLQVHIYETFVEL